MSKIKRWSAFTNCSKLCKYIMLCTRMLHLPRPILLQLWIPWAKQQNRTKRLFKVVSASTYLDQQCAVPCYWPFRTIYWPLNSSETNSKSCYSVENERHSVNDLRQLCDYFLQKNVITRKCYDMWLWCDKADFTVGLQPSRRCKRIVVDCIQRRRLRRGRPPCRFKLLDAIEHILISVF